jgi:hypothetical protein
MSGKGDTSRPFDVPYEQYEANHEAIFGKRERRVYVPPPLPQQEETKKEDRPWQQ